MTLTLTTEEPFTENQHKALQLLLTKGITLLNITVVVVQSGSYSPLEAPKQPSKKYSM